MAAAVDAPAGIDRFGTPLYTVPEVARYLDVPRSTLASWTGDRRHGLLEQRDVVDESALITSAHAARGAPTIPFVGLAEAMVIAALRHGGALPRRVRPVLARLERDLGIHHVLASQQLWSKRANLLDAIGMEACFSRITFGPDGYASLIRLPGYEVAGVVVDPTRGFGQPIFSEGGARLDDALAMLRAGEPLESVAAELGMSCEHLEDAAQVATDRGR